MMLCWPTDHFRGELKTFIMEPGLHAFSYLLEVFLQHRQPTQVCDVSETKNTDFVAKAGKLALIRSKKVSFYKTEDFFKAAHAAELGRIWKIFCRVQLVKESYTEATCQKLLAFLETMLQSYTVTKCNQ